MHHFICLFSYPDSHITLEQAIEPEATSSRMQQCITGAQVQDWVADQLTRAMEGDESSPVAVVDLCAQLAQAVQQGGRVRPSEFEIYVGLSVSTSFFFRKRSRGVPAPRIGWKRLRRRSDPERSSSRPGSRDCDSRRVVTPQSGDRNINAVIGNESESVRRNEEPVRKPKRRQPSAVVVREVGISYSFTAGILLSSENKRSISPESNDSISEELNHFKPIVCSPCTPPKRLPDGQLMEPTIVKSTPRNLTRGMHKATSYEASPAVLQKWRQIELDRQSLKVNSKATLTSPVSELHDAAKTHHTLAGDGVVSVNKRKLLFDPPTGDMDGFQKQSVKIWVPAIRYSGEAALRGDSDFEPAAGAPESGSGTLFSQKQSFSPYTKNSGFQSCKLVPKDSQSPRKESDNQSTSRRGKKRNQKTKHLDLGQDSDQVQQDRALALKLQRQFDLENQTVTRRRSPDKVKTLYLKKQRNLLCYFAEGNNRPCLRQTKTVVSSPSLDIRSHISGLTYQFYL
ncbi:hypothetical protein PAMP_018055 [Pampus punctatissimus]